MGRRKKKKTNGIALTASGSGSPDVPVKDAITEVKEEILEQARKLACNEIFTFYPLVEAAKELVELEGEEAASAAPEELEF